MTRKNGVLYGQAYNDVDYFVKRTENKKTIWTCPFYKMWHPMMTRCFSENTNKSFQHMLTLAALMIGDICPILRNGQKARTGKVWFLIKTFWQLGIKSTLQKPACLSLMH